MKKKVVRNRTVLFRLSDQEFERLLKQVKASGLSREEYLRSLITDTSVGGFTDEFIKTRLNKTITERGDGDWQ